MCKVLLLPLLLLLLLLLGTTVRVATAQRRPLQDLPHVASTRATSTGSSLRGSMAITQCCREQGQNLSRVFKLAFECLPP
jgi:hypothetical protein